MSHNLRSLGIINYIKEADSSIFLRNHYEVNIDFQEFPIALHTWIDRNIVRDYDDGKIQMDDVVKNLPNTVPEWQRDNDKWSEEMQASYILNYLKGFVTSPIVLYCIKDNKLGKRGSKILDGFQRTSALFKFFGGSLELNLNGQNYFSHELLRDENFKRFIVNKSIKIQIITFDNEIQAVEHYIDMNENISHSKEDIQRAKDYLAKLKSKK